jgi:hypothetical protein
LLIGKQFVVSRLVDQYLNNRQNDILWKLLANPADNGHLYGYNLQQLAKDFPQSGLLQALLARANRGEGMHHAAASFNPKALYVMMNAYDNLAGVSNEQIIQELDGSISYAGAIDEEHASGLNDFSSGQLKDIIGFEPQTGPAEGDSEKVVVGDDEQHEVENITFNPDAEHELAETAVIEETADERQGEPELEKVIELTDTETGTVPEPLIPEAEEEVTTELAIGDDEVESLRETPAEDYRAETQSDVFEEEIIEWHDPETEEPMTEVEGHHAEKETDVFEEDIIELPETNVAIADEEATVIENVAELSESIDDEVYDEITGIDSFSFMIPRKQAEEITPEIEAASGEVVPESIAGTDYFVFEKAEQRNEEPGITENEAVVSEHEVPNEPAREQAVFEADTRDVSKYYDEKMPYSFMWWLDKTRKEHASVYQPFKLDTTQAIKHTADGTLQQQYYENIFHITTVSELDSSKQTIAFDLENKEDRLIKKFIIEEPHISTPSGDKLDNENKAKKSAEDQDELVTETLAQIYVDQMLYHKAINTYKKLMLKFPEKSRYFADQIEQLERKTN